LKLDILYSRQAQTLHIKNEKLSAETKGCCRLNAVECLTIELFHNLLERLVKSLNTIGIEFSSFKFLIRLGFREVTAEVIDEHHRHVVVVFLVEYVFINNIQQQVAPNTGVAQIRADLRNAPLQVDVFKELSNSIGAVMSKF
jgi:hypothetical protein